MDDLIYHLAASITMTIVIAFSLYMLRNSKGKMSEAFKIIIFGHVPMLVVHGAKTLSFLLADFELSDIKFVFLEQTAQVIAALSIFIAIYLIKQGSFQNIGDAENG